MDIGEDQRLEPQSQRGHNEIVKEKKETKTEKKGRAGRYTSNIYILMRHFNNVFDLNVSRY